jgi:hypothetical protein
MFSEHGYRTIRGIAVSDERDPQRYMSDVDARAVNHLTDLRQTHLTDLNRDAVGK